jgi:hypothetical protein
MKNLLYIFIVLLFINNVQAEDTFIEGILNKFPWVNYVLSGLGSLMILAQTVIAITPSKKDDAWWQEKQKGVLGKLFKFFTDFAPIQKKK